MQTYCVGCHNARTRTAGLDLASLDIDNAPAHAEIWEKVVRKLRTGAMPPAGDAEAGRGRLRRAGLVARARARRGAVAARRRTGAAPAEPHGVRQRRARPAGRSRWTPRRSCRPTTSAGGFDNNAGALGVSPALLERYLSAAAKIGALAVGDPALLGPSAQTYVVRGDASQTAHVEGLPLGTRGGVVARHTFPLDGEYVLKASLLADEPRRRPRPARAARHRVLDRRRRVFLATVGGNEDNARAAANTADIIAALDTRLTTRVTVTAGPHVVGASFLSRTAAQGGSKLQPFLRTTLDAGDHSGLPHVASLTITGPFDATGPGDTPSRQRIFSCRPRVPADESRCARTILSALAYRGYRRPVTSAEIDRLLTLYRAGRQQGSFDTGIEFGLRAILASPKFVFRTERRRSPEPSIGRLRAGVAAVVLPVEQHPGRRAARPGGEAASCSTGACSSGRCAACWPIRGRRRSSSNFAGQWLQLRNLRSIAPDTDEFPDFDDNLRQAFQRETELFFDSIVREDRSVARPADRRLHVRERAAGAALRHPGRLRQPLPPRDAAR